MMTQEQIIQTFKQYPRPLKSSVLRKLMEVFEDDLVQTDIEESSNRPASLTRKDRLAIVENLAGSIKMDNPPMTREEEREFIYQHRAEKHK